MRIHLDLDDETRTRLIDSAVEEWRPVTLQAHVLLRRALGLPVSVEETPGEGGTPAQRKTIGSGR